MYEVQRWLYDGSISSVLSIFAALLSVAAAAYVTFILKRLTKRDSSAREKLRSEMDEWMSNVRQSYAKNIPLGGPKTRG
ncbi:hypothetical protein NLM33_36135 [Bradyrhizobium sp. CCGUVB1N3]|uniref:hypothetical protein n=1 Tax=Bradyrhizobium sp. CCGUVB1N3 TaxID=2949629 RepID=UPI0020B2E9EA|nr:hypothetical protein [Bradyrhizobium sp. CCGUVB1N3]MCP3475701.1 hypothetical protein [Bradyrhizobium sp. CCGUVB1N3]